MAHEAQGSYIVTFSTLGRNKTHQPPEQNLPPRSYPHDQTNVHTTNTPYQVQQGYTQNANGPINYGHSAPGILYLPHSINNQLGYQYNSASAQTNQGFYTAQQPNVYPDIQERQSVPGYYGHYTGSGHAATLGPSPVSAIQQQHQQLSASRIGAEPSHGPSQTQFNIASETLYTTNIPQSLDDFKRADTLVQAPVAEDVTDRKPNPVDQIERLPITEVQIERIPVTEVQVEKHSVAEVQTAGAPVKEAQIERNSLTEKQIERTLVTEAQIERNPVTEIQRELTSLDTKKTIDTKVQVDRISQTVDICEIDSDKADSVNMASGSLNDQSRSAINQMEDEEDDYATVGDPGTTAILNQIQTNQNIPQTSGSDLMSSNQPTKIEHQFQPSEDDNKELYTTVNRPQSSARTSAKLDNNKNSGDDIEPIYFKPPIPEKTADAYLEKDQESVGSSNGERFDSTTSSKAEMMKFAAEVKQEHYTDMEFAAEVEQDHYTDVKFAATKKDDDNDEDEDDYATVDCVPFPAQTQESVNRIPEQELSPQAANTVPVVNGTSEQDITEAATNQVKQLDINRVLSEVSIPVGFRLAGSRVVLFHYVNITQLKVDVVVNAANSKLKHGSGVAGALAKAAGKDLEKESKKIVKSRGEIPVSKVAMTTSGKLQCKNVMHAVGPRWSNYTNKDQCIQLLKDTFVNIFKKCSEDKVASVAVPPISSGVFGVPVDHVINAIYEVILNLDELCPNPGFPNKIHLVDIKNKALLDVALRLKSGPNKTWSGHGVTLEDVPHETTISEIASVVIHEEPKTKKQKGLKLPKSKGQSGFSASSSLKDRGTPSLQTTQL